MARDQGWSCRTADTGAGAHDINCLAWKPVSIPVEVSGSGPCDVAPNQQSSLRAQRSNPFFLTSLLRHGLLRGACHRARIRATRWLAMTARHGFTISPNGFFARCSFIPALSELRAQGMPGVRCARGLVCKM